MEEETVKALIDKGIQRSEELRIKAIKNKNSLEAAAHRGANKVLESLKGELGWQK